MSDKFGITTVTIMNHWHFFWPCLFLQFIEFIKLYEFFQSHFGIQSLVKYSVLLCIVCVLKLYLSFCVIFSWNDTSLFFSLQSRKGKITQCLSLWEIPLQIKKANKCMWRIDEQWICRECLQRLQGWVPSWWWHSRPLEQKHLDDKTQSQSNCIHPPQVFVGGDFPSLHPLISHLNLWSESQKREGGSGARLYQTSPYLQLYTPSHSKGLIINFICKLPLQSASADNCPLIYK